MDYNQQYGKLAAYLDKAAKDSVVMLQDTANYDARRYYLTEDFKPEHIEACISDWSSVSISTADKSAIIKKYISHAQRMQANMEAEYMGMDVPDMYSEDLNHSKWLNDLNRLGMSEAIGSEDVSYKPIVLVDIDIKDNTLYLKEIGLLDEEDIEMMDSAKNRSHKVYVHTLPLAKRMECIEALVDIKTIVKETQPMHILFSGGGCHIWYALPYKTDAYRYETLHKEIVKKLVDVCPDTVIDKAASSIIQNVRLPGSFNVKAGTRTECTTLYDAEEYEVADWVKTIHQGLKPRKVQANIRTLQPNVITGTLITEAFQAEKKKSSKRSGFRNIKRDLKMWDFIQQYLTYENICEYMQVDPGITKSFNRPDKEPYMLCHSPLRQDNNPSFFVYPNSLKCYDKAKTYYLDYGELMFKLIEGNKKRFNIIGDTTRYEAELHCVLCAFLVYRAKNKTNKFPLTSEEEHTKYIERKEAEGVVFSEAYKKRIPGKKHYLNMSKALSDQIGKAVRGAVDSTKPLQYLLENMPSVYFFYDVTQSSAGNALLSSITALTAVYFLNKLNLGVQKSGSREYKVYVINNRGMHTLWDEYLLDNSIAGKDGPTSQSNIHRFLMLMNATEAGNLPTGTPNLAKYLAESINTLGDMDLYLSNKLGYDQLMPSTLKESICDIIGDLLLGVVVNPRDINVSVLNQQHYIEFNNNFVIYNSPVPEEIGTYKPCTAKNKYELMRSSVVDIRINCDYNPEVKSTPLFTKYITSMTYLNNKFDKCLSYFLGSSFYHPVGTPTRALILYGHSGDNGKSVLGYIVTNLFGKQYVAFKQIADITATNDKGKNTRMGLLNKLINITTDAAINKISNSFKQMVEGEAIQVRELYKKERDVCLRTHYLISANRMPEIWGETQAFIKRVLLVKLSRSIPIDKRIPALGQKIVEREGPAIWPWILEQAKIFKTKGLEGFLSRSEIIELETQLLTNDDLYDFINKYVTYDETVAPLPKTKFKKLYNRYRRANSKNDVKTDSIIADAESFFRIKFKDIIPESTLERGFEFRSSVGRGLPLHILVPAKDIGMSDNIDSVDDD